MSSTISQYKTYLKDYLETKHNIKNPKSFFHCLNPEHIDNNPSMMYTSKYEICHCFSCGASYDIFDLVGMDYNLNNFREQLLKIQELYLGYTPNVNKECVDDNKIYDYTNYYKKCLKNMTKTNYLQNRKITNKLILKYNIGYDEVRNLIVFPINKNCYFARSTVNNDKRKSKGKSDIWNYRYLKDSNDNSLIYVTEGIIDALSLEVIDSNIKVMSINGVGNLKSLVNAIKKENYNGYIAVVFDNDNAGIKASKELVEELAKINVNSFSNTLISNFDANICTDLNKALMIDKDKLKENYEYVNATYKNIIEKEKKGVELNYG